METSNFRRKIQVTP